MDLEQDDPNIEKFDEPFQIFLPPPALNEIKRPKKMPEKNKNEIVLENKEELKSFLIQNLKNKIERVQKEIWEKKLKKFLMKLINLGNNNNKQKEVFEIQKRIKIIFINIGKDLKKEFNDFSELLYHHLYKNGIQALKPLDHEIFNNYEGFDILCKELETIKTKEDNKNFAILFNGIIRNYNEEKLIDFIKLFNDEILSKESLSSLSFIWYLPIEGAVNFQNPFHFLKFLYIDFYDSETLFRKILFAYLSIDFLPLFDKESLRNLLNNMEIFDINLNEAMRRLNMHFLLFIKNLKGHEDLAILEQNLVKKDKIEKKIKNKYVDVWDSQAKISIGLQLIKEIHKKAFYKNGVEKSVFRFLFETGKYKGLNEKIYSIKSIEEIEKIGKDIACIILDKPKQIKGKFLNSKAFLNIKFEKDCMKSLYADSKI